MATQVVEKIPTGYVSRERAIEILEKSETSIERLVRTGEIASRLFPAPGRRPIRYYTEESLTKFKELEERKIAARPPSQLVKTVIALKQQRHAEAEPTSLALAVPDAAVNTLRELVERWLAPKPVPLTEKLWLSLDESVELSGLARTDLLSLIAKGSVSARKSGGWRIRRASLEAFEG